MDTNSIIQTFDYYYTRYWTEHCDPRFNKTFLMSGGPWQMLTITMTYLTAVTIIGPYIMRNRKPMNNLIWPIRVYNAFMVLLNAYLFLNFSVKLNWGLDCWGCGKSMKRMDSAGLILWELTLLSRYFDFFDSLFFVCRKKLDHLSLLHVAHHTLVPIIVWFAGKFEPTPMVVFAGYINLPIHVIMYTYYCLSTFPSLRKYLWWKRYITSIQIIQFCLDLLHSLQIFLFPSCKYHTLTYVQTAFSLTFLYLFCQFYLRSYLSSKSSKSERVEKTKTIDQASRQEKPEVTNDFRENNNCKPVAAQATVSNCHFRKPVAESLLEVTQARISGSVGQKHE